VVDRRFFFRRARDGTGYEHGADARLENLRGGAMSPYVRKTLREGLSCTRRTSTVDATTSW
jgi:hypothetical protein